jgi:hypothetical protein
MPRSWERRLTVEWGKMSCGGGASIQMLVRAVLRCLEVDTQLQGVGREVATCFVVRETHGGGKGRRGCLSCCYELGGERTGAGPAPQQRGGGERPVRSARHAHEQGPLAGSDAGTIEAGSGRARGTEQRSGEMRGRVRARGLRSAIMGRPREKEDDHA